MADSTPKSYHTDPTLYLYTSLTAGSSHVTTATSRLETILKANRIPFQALDVATDEKARMLWGRRAGKRKLPGLVRMGMLVGDLNEIEEWNEYGELKEKIGVQATPSTPSASAANTPSKAPATTSTSSTSTNTNTNSPSKLMSSISTPPKQVTNPMATAMRQAGAEAAKKAGDARALKAKGVAPSTTGASASPSQLMGLGSETAGGVKDDGTSRKGSVTKATKPASEKAAMGDGADDEDGDEDEDETAEGTKATSEDPDAEAVVTGSKDTIAVNETGSKSKDPDAEAVVPGSKDTISVENSTQPAESKPDQEDSEADTTQSSGQNTTTSTTTEGIKPTLDSQNDGNDGNEDDDSEESEPDDQKASAEKEKITAATTEVESLPGKSTQAQESAKAEEAGTSVGD
ncbi:MAG: hypothetical protein Q9226_007294 [Calogaya cf. arnoldii]